MLHFYYTELYLLLEYFSSTQMFQKQEENLVKNYQWLLMKTKKTLDFWNKKYSHGILCFIQEDIELIMILVVFKIFFYDTEMTRREAWEVCMKSFLHKTLKSGPGLQRKKGSVKQYKQ